MAANPGLIDELYNSPLLKGLAAAEVSQFLDACEKTFLSAWSKVFQGGETKRSLFILVKGSVQILLEGLGDEHSVLAELQSGDVFGESNFFHACAHHSTALCTSDAVLVELPRAKYEELLAANSLLALRVGANAAEILATRLQATDEWVQNFLTGHHREDSHLHLLAFRQKLPHGFTPKAGFSVGGL